MNNEIAIFGGGCFWCTEAVFASLKGVKSVMPGYAGGDTKNPTYEQVCSGTTGHAEVTRIEFDPTKISFKDLLTVFFATHDPTTLNAQGNDVGTQYRSTILFTTEQQKKEAETFIQELNEGATKKIVTKVEPLKEFYEAEEYHQNYFAKNPNQPYCQLIISPKLEKLQKRFSELLASSDTK
jgi:peptide-methionine (S)-S-oxide reductase